MKRQEENSYQFNPKKIIKKNKTNTIIFDFIKGKFYALDSLSVNLVENLITGDINKRINEISNDYNTSTEKIKEDCQELFSDLLKNKIIIKKSKESSVPNNFTIYSLLILAKICLKIFGLLPTIRIWRFFHKPIYYNLAPQVVKTQIETLSQRVKTQNSKILFLNIDCKERAIVGWTILQSMGIKAELVLGVQYEPFAMHAWCESQDFIVGDEKYFCSYWESLIKIN